MSARRRRAAVTGLGALAGVALTGSVAEYLFTGSTSLWVANTAWTAAAAFAVGGIANGLRRFDAEGARGPWRLLLAGTGCWLAGQLLWNYYSASHLTPPTPSPADAGWLAFAAFAIVAVYRLAPVPRGVGRYALLDAIALLIAAGALGATLFYHESSTSALSGLARVTVIGYPVLYVAAALGFVQVLVQPLGVRERPALLLLFLGVLLEALAFVLWTPLLLHQSYVVGTNAVDALWTAGMLVTGVAGVLAPTSKPVAVRTEAELRRGAIPPALAFLTLVALLPVFALNNTTLGTRLIVQLAIIVLAILFAVRSWLLSTRHLALATREREAKAAAEETAAELDRFFTLSPDLLCTAGFDGHFHLVNHRFEEVLGYSANELYAQPYITFVHPDEREGTAREVERLAQGTETVGFENRYRRSDGSYLWLRWNAVPAPDGTVIYASARDVSDRKLAEESLRGSELRFRAVTRSVSDAVITANGDGEIIFWNEGASLIFGYAEEEMLGQPLTVLMPERYREGHRKGLARLRTTGEPRLIGKPIELNGLRNDGSEFPLELSLGAWELGDESFYSGVIRDVTERRRVEEETERSREEAARANQAKSEFLSRMSHELRTPLNAILGFGQLLELDELDERKSDHVHQILKAGRHLLELINEVLEISRIEAGELAISPEPVSLAETVREALALVEPMAADRDVRLSVDVGGLAKDGHVHADRQRLRQVLLNLLSNAIKYNRTGGRVDVSFARGDGTPIRTLIADTGLGIDREQLAGIFEPFERLGAELSEVEGTGLGLALAKRLLEAMGGSIAVASEPGRGSTFTIELQASEAPDGLPVVGVPEGAMEEIGSGLEPGHHRILYIEDNPSNLTLVERILDHHPAVDLLPAMQGRLGLELAREHQPGMILLDLHLPDIQGEEVLRRLKADELTREIPVVVLSADASTKQSERLLRLGAREYLTKPLDVKRFLEVIVANLDAGERA
jgi:PAS domain S-box-containing protein